MHIYVWNEIMHMYIYLVDAHIWMNERMNWLYERDIYEKYRIANIQIYKWSRASARLNIDI